MLHAVHHAQLRWSRRLHGATTLGSLALAAGITLSPADVAAQWCPPSTPVSCPAGSCAASARECASIEGCPPTAPHRCSNGACAQNDAACTSAPAPVEPGAAPPVASAPTVEPSVSDAPSTLAEGVATAEAARVDAELAADDAEAAREDAQVAAEEARESLQALQTHEAECPETTPVDCGDGTCTSSIFACSPIDSGPAPASRVGEAAELLTDEERRAAQEVDEQDNGVADSEGCTAGVPGASGAAAGASAVAVGLITLVASRARRSRKR